MIAYYIIAILSTVIWIFPLIKQYRTKYFNYFLVNAIAGIILPLIYYVFKIQFNYLYPAFYLFMLASLIKSNKLYIVLVMAVIAAVLIPIIQPSSRLVFGFAVIIDLTIYIIILHDLFERFMNSREINLFLMILSVYLSIDLSKLFDIAINLNLGAIYYYFGVASQILFGIAFCFINVNTKNYKVRIKMLEDL